MISVSLIEKKSDRYIQTAACRELSTNIKQITETSHALEKVAQENAANTEETTAASEELASLTEESNAIVAELNLLVEGHHNRSLWDHITF